MGNFCGTKPTKGNHKREDLDGNNIKEKLNGMIL